MKHLFQSLPWVLATWICSPAQTQAQSWVAQTGAATTNLRAVHFTSPTVGWIVGRDHLVFKTENGGNTWIGQPVSGIFGGYFYDIHFFLEEYGCAVGNYGNQFGYEGYVAVTNNGGQNWSIVPPLPTITGVYFISATQGWMCGEGGAIFTTTNSGNNWSQQTSGVTGYIYKLCFVSPTQGWAVGANGVILTTTDGGTNWTPQTSGTSNGLNAVQFLSSTEGWACGEGGTILHTTNGGTTWTAQNSGTTDLLYSLFFVSLTEGWAVGAPHTILHTSNGGATWTAQTHPATDCLVDVFFTSSSNGWVVGDNGTILKYSALTGIERLDNPSISDTKIYPNPTQNILNIETTQTFSNYQLINTLGQIVANNKLYNNQIDLSSFNKGIYQLVLQTPDKQQFAKTIILE